LGIALPDDAGACKFTLERGGALVTDDHVQLVKLMLERQV
jgi:hypothetical protein